MLLLVLLPSHCFKELIYSPALVHSASLTYCISQATDPLTGASKMHVNIPVAEVDAFLHNYMLTCLLHIETTGCFSLQNRLILQVSFVNPSNLLSLFHLGGRPFPDGEPGQPSRFIFWSPISTPFKLLAK